MIKKHLLFSFCLFSMFSLHAMETPSKEYIHIFAFSIEGGTIKDHIVYINELKKPLSQKFIEQLTVIAEQAINKKYPTSNCELIETSSVLVENNSSIGDLLELYSRRYPGKKRNVIEQRFEENDKELESTIPIMQCTSHCWKIIKRLATWCCKYKKQQ